MTSAVVHGGVTLAAVTVVSDRLQAMIPRIGGLDTMVVMHNDAVVQCLGQVPSMRDVEHWGAMMTGEKLAGPVPIDFAAYRAPIIRSEATRPGYFHTIRDGTHA